MAYQVLARKYRPIRFSDVVGQDHVTRTLLNALAQNRIAHGYIFSGHRGIGKTTIARIVASALNCRTEIGTAKRPTPEPCNDCESCLEIRQSSSVDVIEIDAATNRGIDEVRELRDAARYRPARDKFKIIILDEAHQITDAAFNALLKTLEEPPDHIVFMFATTEPENIPQTIRSRCQHFSFHAVKLDDIVGQLRKISTEENILVDDATLSLLAEAGDGSMRDALSIMDQAIASAPVEDGKPSLETAQVRELMGSVSNVIYEQVLEAVHRNNSADVLGIVARLLDAGNGPSQIARQFVRFLRNCVVAKITGLTPDAPATGIAADLLQTSPEERSRAARSASLFTEEELSRFLAVMLRTFDELGYRQEQRFHLELGLLKLVHLQRLIPVEELLSQLGVPAPAKQPNTTPTSAALPQPATTLSSRPERSAVERPAVPTADPATTLSSRPERSAVERPAVPTADPATTLSSRPERSVVERPAAPTPDPASPPSSRPERSAVERPAVSTADPATTLSSRPERSAVERPAVLTADPATTLSSRPERSAVERPAVPAPSADPFARPPSSPFDIDRTRKTPQASATQSTAAAPTTAGSLAIAPAPEPPRPQPEPTPSAEATDRPHLVSAPRPAAPTSDLAALQAALVDALASSKAHESASHQIEDATFTIAGDTLQIQTSVSKAMLPILINAEANRILSTTLRQQAPGLKLALLPGTPASASAKKPSSRPARAGSVQELAENHPVVQEAKRLFSAEISNVIDLRDK